MYATAGSTHDDGGNDLLGIREHINLLKRLRINYADHNDKIKARKLYLYAVRGQRIFRSAFAVLTELNKQKITRHSRSLAMTPAFLSYETSLHESHSGRLSTRRVIVDAFIDHTAATFALEFPKPRGSHDNNTFKLLPSDMTRVEVYNSYSVIFSGLREAVLERVTTRIPDKPLSFSAFTPY